MESKHPRGNGFVINDRHVHLGVWYSEIQDLSACLKIQNSYFYTGVHRTSGHLPHTMSRQPRGKPQGLRLGANIGGGIG